MIKRLRYIIEAVKWGNLLHTIQNIALPVILFVLVDNSLVELAVVLVVLSKWRMFAVQPHHWLANLRSGGVDLIVGVSAVIMMQAVSDLVLLNAEAGAVQSELSKIFLIQMGIALLYMCWLILLKPRSTPIMMSLQSLVAQTVGTIMLFWLANNLAEVVLVVLAWAIAYVSALHFFGAHEDQFKGVLTLGWALFVAQFSFIINRWLLGYEIAGTFRISNAVILIFVFSYTIGTLYMMWIEERLTSRAIRQYTAILLVITISVISLTNWSGAV